MLITKCFPKLLLVFFTCSINIRQHHWILKVSALQPASSSFRSQSDDHITRSISSRGVGGIMASAKSEAWARRFLGQTPSVYTHAENEALARTHALFTELGEQLRRTTNDGGEEDAPRPSSCSTNTPFLVRCGDAAPLVIFGTAELEKAIESDFLDAEEGSTGRHENDGWRTKPVAKSRYILEDEQRDSINSEPGPYSFSGSRVSFSDVQAAKGTVIFNSAGAYISSTLAAASLAALDGLNGLFAGVCLNMYVTKGDAKVSAPPHTDKQDVLVIQTQGRKHWKIFSPTNNDSSNRNKQNNHPVVDPFARGKGADRLTLQTLEESGSRLLFEATLHPGDLLFVPARFPHTTDTLSCYQEEVPPKKDFNNQDWSIHMTVGLDSHVWSMNYLSMRRMGLFKFGLLDVLAKNGATVDDESCMETIHTLTETLREQLFASVDGAWLVAVNSSMLPAPGKDLARTQEVTLPSAHLEEVARELYLVNKRVSAEMMNDAKQKDDITLNMNQCREIVSKFFSIGQQILTTHREMYISAMDEEIVRRTEIIPWSAAGENSNTGRISQHQQMERLSIFRVPAFFERLDDSRTELRTWASGGKPAAWANDDEKLHLLLNGDQVEVRNLATSSSSSLGRSSCNWSSAKVVECRIDGLYDLQLFDGEVMKGIAREAIKGPHGIGIFI